MEKEKALEEKIESQRKELEERERLIAAKEAQAQVFALAVMIFLLLRIN